jgi:hypothetical protein
MDSKKTRKKNQRAYQVPSECLLDHDGGVHLALLPAAAGPHLRQLPGGHRRPPPAVSHARPRTREAPPPLLDRRCGPAGEAVLLDAPVAFLLAGEHLLDPAHGAAHGDRVVLSAGRSNKS